MTTIINAVTSTGLTQTADGSGIIKVQSNGVTTNALAWVNFNGTSASPITPRANYNVSSVTKNGTGDYTLTFTNALSDANYAAAGMTGYTQGTPGNATVASIFISEGYLPTTSSLRVRTITATSTLTDNGTTTVVIFGN